MKYFYIFLFLHIGILTSFSCFAGEALTQAQTKIFSFQRTDSDAKVNLPELNSRFIYGISWRFTWMNIEPEHGQYNWDLIDRAVELAGKFGKKVMLRVVPGINTPNWVYQAGSKPFDFSNTDLAHPENYPKSLRMPIPWDEVYLTKWEEFVQAFGRRYDGNSFIYSIQMAGGGHIGEMNLPKAYKKWQQVGYSDEKLFAAWKRIINAYQIAFPNIPTNLDINEPLGRRSNVLEPVVSFVLTTYPRKVYLQQNGLKADLSRENRIRQILREASRQTIVGYQMAGGKNFLDKFARDRISAYRNALEDGASYIEVYASDVRDPGQRRALEFLATRSEENRQ